MTSHSLRVDVQTQRTEIQTLKNENHALTNSDAALHVTNAKQHSEITSDVKKMQSKSGVPEAIRGKEDFKIVEGRKDIDGGGSSDSDAKAKGSKVPHDTSGEDTTVDKPKCDRSDKDPKPTANNEGMYRVTHCGPDGKPTDRTVFNLDGKTKTSQISYGADGGTKIIAFAADGKTASNVQVDHPNRDTELTTLGKDGHIPISYFGFNHDATSVDISCDGKGNAVSASLKGLYGDRIKPKASEDIEKLKQLKESVCKPVDLNPYGGGGKE
jgi:hypothetical protein